MCPRCCSVVWLSLFSYVHLDQLKLCGVCVDGLAYVCECYVVVNESDEPPHCMCSLSVSLLV